MGIGYRPYSADEEEDPNYRFGIGSAAAQLEDPTYRYAGYSQPSTPAPLPPAPQEAAPASGSVSAVLRNIMGGGPLGGPSGPVDWRHVAEGFNQNTRAAREDAAAAATGAAPNFEYTPGKSHGQAPAPGMVTGATGNQYALTQMRPRTSEKLRTNEERLNNAMLGDMIANILNNLGANLLGQERPEQYNNYGRVEEAIAAERSAQHDREVEHDRNQELKRNAPNVEAQRQLEQAQRAAQAAEYDRSSPVSQSVSDSIYQDAIGVGHTAQEAEELRQAALSNPRAIERIQHQLDQERDTMNRREQLRSLEQRTLDSRRVRGGGGRRAVPQQDVSLPNFIELSRLVRENSTGQSIDPQSDEAARIVEVATRQWNGMDDVGKRQLIQGLSTQLNQSYANVGRATTDVSPENLDEAISAFSALSPEERRLVVKSMDPRLSGAGSVLSDFTQMGLSPQAAIAASQLQAVMDQHLKHISGGAVVSAEAARGAREGGFNYLNPNPDAAMEYMRRVRRDVNLPSQRIAATGGDGTGGGNAGEGGGAVQLYHNGRPVGQPIPRAQANEFIRTRPAGSTGWEIR